MRARRVRIADETIDSVFGTVLASDARGEGRVILRKGTRLGEGHRPALAALSGVELHLLELEPDELEQDEVARRLSRVVAGAGTEPLEPEQGQARVVSLHRGLVRVRNDDVARLNALHPLLCFCRASGQIVVAGDEVAGLKSAALATPSEVMRDAERIAPGIVSVAAFSPRRTGVVMTDRISGPGRTLMAEAIRRKIEWFGSSVVATVEVEHRVDAVALKLRELLAAGAELILVSGANSLDPLDAVLEAIRHLDGRIDRRGVPAHPGSMVWIGSVGAVPFLGIATCAGFGKNTALDLLLARVLAGADAAAAADELGAAGLVEGDGGAQWFPPYARGGSATRVTVPVAAD